MKLYESIDVWMRGSSGELTRYRCFRVLPNSGCCVQSSDSFQSTKSELLQLDKQFIELLSEQEPDDRSGAFGTLEEAIAAFDRDFGNEERER